MFLAGINFLIHYQVLRGNFSGVRTNKELHFYVKTIVTAIVIMTGILYLVGIKPVEQSAQHYRHTPQNEQEYARHVAEEAEKVSTLYGAFRYASFQAVSITTTTGYGTADFDIWPDLCRFGLLFLMFWGGCAGSTGGGMKMIRVLVIFKVGWRELQKMVRPHLVAPLKIGGVSMEEERVINIGAFFIMFMALFVLASLLMTLFIPDLVTSIATVAATLGNIGPGLNGIGSAHNYGWIPIPGKWVLIVCMLLGRLEIFTVLIALRPSTWKK